MIGIVVPAHNEEAVIARCLESLIIAAAHTRLLNEQVYIVVVMDDCTDGTRAVVDHYPVHGIAVCYRNVGEARAAGVDHLLREGARWLAFTDADTQVPETWLADQLACKTDAVCGVVGVDDWSAHSDAVRIRYDAHYSPTEGHRHIHGANLGVSAEAYRRVGGFKPLKTHEDVQLVTDLEGAGASITWTAVNCVTTSARLECRCRDGFGDYLRSLVAAPSLEASR
jgi:glycosyltransferase involved in cell wall biosynthesis